MHRLLSRARLLFCAAAPIFAALAGAEARIESFSPTGFIKDVRQVAVRFSEPMVALGDPDRSDPFAVRCAVPGSGRWIDERNWVYDFAHEVPGAERCRFTLRRGVTTLAGERVAEPHEHEFHTGGPTILDDLAYTGWAREIDERQVVLLALDAVADEGSIGAHAHCRVEGASDRIAVDVVSGAARSDILDALAAHHADDLDELVESATTHLSKDDAATLRERALTRIALVRCAETLPGHAKVDLVWGAGVAGTNGAANRSDQVLSYTVRPPFLAGFSCSATLQDKCLGSVSVGFTATLERKFAKHLRLVDSDGVEVPAIVRDDPQIQYVRFEGTLAEDSSYTVELTGPIEDIDGRPLDRAAFPLVIRTGTPPPGATFGNGVSFVAPNDAAAMPVLLHHPQTSLQGRRLLLADEADIARWTLDFEDRERPRSSWGGHETALLGDAVPGTAPFELPIEKPTAGFQVSTVPTAGAGLHILELTQPPSRDLAETRYVAGRAVKTRLAVHFQHGRESSLIWVTGIDDARPVADAVVRITNGCSGRSVWQGRTDTLGLARLATTLPRVEDCDRPFYLVSARKDGDLAFVAAEAPWRNRWGSSTPLKAHTILDRSLFQPGETVSMKHVFRLATSDGFALPDLTTETVRLSIRSYHGEAHAEEIDVDANGTATSTFRIPDNAKLGRYRVTVRVGDGYLNESGGFRVERFRVGSLRASVETPTLPIIAPESVPLDLAVQHLAGGGAAGLEVVVRATVDPHYNEDSANTEPTQPITRVVDAKLDDLGKARIEIPGLPRLPDGGVMVAEMDYRDDNGQIRTASNRFSLWPAAIRLEIEPGKSQWPSVPPARVRAYDLNGSPVPDIAIEVEFDSVAAYDTVSRRLPGGFRTSTTRTTWKTEAGCSAVTDIDGTVLCPMPSHLEGGALVRATARDEQGNLARASRWIRPRWDNEFLDVVGNGAIEPGDSVPVRVTVPFEDATALVSVQREGVLDAFITRVQGPQSIVEIPIKPNYAPNVDVSVLVVAPPESTTAEPIPGDLEVTGNQARLNLESVLPRQRNGRTSIEVGRAANTLAVDVDSDRDAYRVRDRARVRVTVTDPDGQPPRDAELALYAVDEGLLDLWPNPSADLLDAMMTRRRNEVSSTSSLDAMTKSMYLSMAGEEQKYASYGRIRYDGVNPTCCGDMDAPESPIAEVLRRERFDRLLLWHGRIDLNEDGTAEVEIPLNDLVTSFRVVAVATADAHLFGTGEATILTTQDLVVNDGLPPTVREGDRFLATFVVRNASDTPQRVRVVAQAEGLPGLRPRTVGLPPGTSEEVSWRVTVPAGIDRLDWDVTARSGDASDGLVANQTVIAPIPVRVQQSTITQVEGSVELPVAPPAEALPNRGGVGVSLRRSIAGGLDAMHEYMSRYPYTCLEQQVSAAVALNDPKRWSDVMADLERWMDNDGLLKYFPSDWLRGSPVLTAYIMTIADANGWTVPEHHRERLIDGLRDSAPMRNRTRRRHDGFPIESGKLTGLTVLAALIRHEDDTYSRMIRYLDYNLDLLPTSGLLDWIDILHRVAPDHGDLATAKGILRARLNLQGTSLGFSTEDRDRIWWLMVSTDGNAARAVLSLIDDPDWRPDMPRMMRGLIGRQQRGRWQTTVANAWGAVATARFAEVFEADPVSGTSVAQIGDEEHRSPWRDDERPAPIHIPWSAGQTLTLRHQGTGAPWSLVELRAAVPLRQAVARGYRIERAVEAADGRDRRTWRRGDVAEIVLTIDADRDMTWVVVEDPLPPGAVVLGSGLGGESSMLASGYQRGDRWPVFTERGFDSYRAYYQYVPKGRFTLRYSARYNTAGRFQLPPARVEAMYAPEMHAEWPVKPVTIR